jgi:hypothetical protein
MAALINWNGAIILHLGLTARGPWELLPTGAAIPVDGGFSSSLAQRY